MKQPQVLLLIGQPSGKEFHASTVERINEFYLVGPWSDSWSATLRAKQVAKRDAKVAELEEIKCRASDELERSGFAWRERRLAEIDELREEHNKVIDDAASSHPVIIAAKAYHGLSLGCVSDYLDDYPARSFVQIIRGQLPELPAGMRTVMELITSADATDDLHVVWRARAETASTRR